MEGTETFFVSLVMNKESYVIIDIIISHVEGQADYDN